MSTLILVVSAIACVVALWISVTKPVVNMNRCVSQCQLQIQIVKDTPCTVVHNGITATEMLNADLSSELIISSDSPLSVTHAIANFECSQPANVSTCRFQNDPNDDATCTKPWDCNGQKLVLIQRAT